MAVGSADAGLASLVAGDKHTCALMNDSTVNCWGINASGELGDGTNTQRLTPVRVSGLSAVTQLATSGSHTCARLSSGGVKCWGNNMYGQLGDGTTTNSNVPVEVMGLSSGVVEVAASNFSSCALMTDSTVKCWGRNHAGQLGTGAQIDSPVPVLVRK